MKGKKSLLERARDVVWVIWLLTIAAGLLYMAIGIMDIMSAPYTSFPWYSACFFTLLYFGPIAAAEGLVYLVLLLICRKRDRGGNKNENKSE